MNELEHIKQCEKNEWKTLLASDYCNGVADGTHDSPQQSLNGKYMITSKHLGDYSLDFPNAYKISLADYEKIISRSKVRQWDILFSMIGTIGRTYQEKNENPDYAIKNVGLFRCGGNKLKSDWLKYFLMSPKAKEYIQSHMRGSTQGYVPLGTLRDLPICVPPLHIQKRITDILSSLDDKIENNTVINHHLEQMAQAIFKSWFVDFEPFGGKMPDDWQKKSLGQYVTIKRGGSPRPIQDFLSDTGYRWLKISDVTSLQTPFVLTIKEHIKESGLHKTVYRKAGTLVLSNSATPGIPKILCIDTCIHDGWLYFPLSLFSNEFLYLFFLLIRKDLIALGNGSVFTNLKTDILKAFPIVYPGEAVLKQFDELVVPLFRKMEAMTKESARLAELRDTLLPRLMSGELSVVDIDGSK